MIQLKKNVVVSANTTEKIPFKLPFKISDSRMDEFGNQFFLLRGVIQLAKWSNAVKSEYRIEAEADVVGTALDPNFSKTIIIK